MKTILITGGARGIGAAIVLSFSEDYRVFFTHHATPPDATLAHCPTATALPCDLTDADQVAALPARVVDDVGHLDVIVNNAAQMAPDSAEEFDVARSAAIYHLNATVPLALAAAALPHLEPGATIINITSTNARLPAMSAHSYSASKAALETWTRIAAKTLGPKGIRVNAVAPGAVNIPEAPRPDELTEIFVKDTALGQLATADDIAAAVRFLASDAARAITGHILDVNGGYRL